MTDSDKFRIKDLDGNSDYALWHLRVEAACVGKGLRDAFSLERALAGSDSNTFVTGKNQASALGDHSLRIVRTVVGKLLEMLEKLDARYDLKSTASKITKMIELVLVRYTNPKVDIPNHMDAMEALHEQR